MIMSMPKPRIRTIVNSDLPDILEIEDRCFNNPLTKQEFKALLQHDIMCWVMEVEGILIGYILASFRRRKIMIFNMAVDPAWQRHGYGKKLLDVVLQHTRNSSKRNRVTCFVPEGNMAALKFLQKNLFLAVKLHRGLYEKEDGIQMVLRIVNHEQATTKICS